MDEQQAPPITGQAVERAVRVLEHHKLTVLEESWQSGRHRLTIIATPGGGILAGVEVRSAASPVPAGCLTVLTADHVTAVVQALQAWNREHGGKFDELWLAIVALHPDGAFEVVSGDAAEVG
jgi:Holliday junction resolvase-like predicted endonuclease